MAGIVSGKVAIVTGGGAASGARLRSGSRKRARASSSATSARACRAPAPMPGRRRKWSTRSGQVGGEAIASTLSIAEPKNADEIVKAALEAFGRVDILVNNAGILRDVIFHKMSWSDWSDVLAVHLNGSFNMSRACAAHFREQNSGAYRAHDLDLGPGRQFRPGQLHGGEARHHGTVARDRARHGSASRCARTASRRSPGRA